MGEMRAKAATPNMCNYKYLQGNTDARVLLILRYESDYKIVTRTVFWMMLCNLVPRETEVIHGLWENARMKSVAKT